MPLPIPVIIDTAHNNGLYNNDRLNYSTWLSFKSVLLAIISTDSLLVKDQM